MCKKFVSALVLTLFLLPALAALASGPVISVESISGDVGETIVVPVRIAQNPGLSAFVLWLDFDSAYLEPVAVTRSELLAGGLFMDNLSDQRQPLSSVNVTWADTGNFTGDGLLYTIHFLVTAAPPGGSVDLAWNMQRSNLSNEDLELVDGLLSGGQVQFAAAGLPGVSPVLVLPPLALAATGAGIYLHRRSKKAGK